MRVSGTGVPPSGTFPGNLFKRSSRRNSISFHLNGASPSRSTGQPDASVEYRSAAVRRVSGKFLQVFFKLKQYFISFEYCFTLTVFDIGALSTARLSVVKGRCVSHRTGNASAGLHPEHHAEVGLELGPCRSCSGRGIAVRGADPV